MWNWLRWEESCAMYDPQEVILRHIWNQCKKNPGFIFGIEWYYIRKCKYVFATELSFMIFYSSYQKLPWTSRALVYSAKCDMGWDVSDVTTHALWRMEGGFKKKKNNHNCCGFVPISVSNHTPHQYTYVSALISSPLHIQSMRRNEVFNSEPCTWW